MGDELLDFFIASGSFLPDNWDELLDFLVAGHLPDNGDELLDFLVAGQLEVLHDLVRDLTLQREDQGGNGGWGSQLQGEHRALTTLSTNKSDKIHHA